MKVTIAGYQGSGKSVLVRRLADRFGYEPKSSGDFMRDMAIERELSLLELSKQAETDKSIDGEIDQRQIDYGKTHDYFVIDARLGWHFIPDSVKLFLYVSDEEGAKRIFGARRPEEKENTTLEATLENIRTRRASERKRYMQYYGLDYTDKSHYDFYLDTSEITEEQVFEKVAAFLKANGAVSVK